METVTEVRRENLGIEALRNILDTIAEGFLVARGVVVDFLGLVKPRKNSLSSKILQSRLAPDVFLRAERRSRSSSHESQKLHFLGKIVLLIFAALADLRFPKREGQINRRPI